MAARRRGRQRLSGTLAAGNENFGGEPAGPPRPRDRRPFVREPARGTHPIRSGSATTYDGMAVHGYHSVPPYPASHGCARVTFDAVDLIRSDDLMAMGSTVLVHGEAPAPGEAV